MPFLNYIEQRIGVQPLWGGGCQSVRLSGFVSRFQFPRRTLLAKDWLAVRSIPFREGLCHDAVTQRMIEAMQNHNFTLNTQAAYLQQIAALDAYCDHLSTVTFAG